MQAIAREQREHDAYSTLGNMVDDPIVKSLFEKISNEELKHKALLEKEFADLF